jgi:glutamate racemase
VSACDEADGPGSRIWGVRRSGAATLERVADSPIGIFDSSFGGLTVARAVLDQLPHESVLYLGDTARQPYGPRPIAEVRKYSLECLDRLVERGVKALVIACNSASAAMLHDARERYDVPVVEVTHQSQAYLDLFAAAPHITVMSRPCPRFVGFVESGVTSGDELLAVAHSYLDPIVARGVDTLILGCTHYPLLTGVISYVMGQNVTLVSSAEETAKDVFRVLADAGMLRPDNLPAPVHEFVTTGDPQEFERLARRFLGPEVVRAHPEPAAAL